MPSESKLRSIYHEVLQDQIINKKHIFYNSNYTNLVDDLGKQNKNKVLCNILCNKNNINNINNYHTLGTFGNKIKIYSFKNHLVWNEFPGSILVKL